MVRRLDRDVDADADVAPGAAMDGADALEGGATDTDHFYSQSPEVFKVGMLVIVQRRMWSGINRPGGVGRVVKVRVVERSPDSGDEDDGVATGGVEYQYDVKYVVEGGRENCIDAEFVELQNQDASRDRSVKGRCRVEHCHSFIRDCGHVQPSEAMIDKIREFNLGDNDENDMDEPAPDASVAALDQPAKVSQKRKRAVSRTNSLMSLPVQGQEKLAAPLPPTTKKKIVSCLL